MSQTRICVVGDALVAGIGDRRALGWVGRVWARTAFDASPVTCFSLGVPGETTAGMAERWRTESELRFGEDTRNLLVLAPGHADAVEGITLPRSRLNLANILDEAANVGIPTFVVGPPPPPDPALTEKVAELSATYADVCLRRQVRFVETYRPLVSHEDWLTDLAAGDGVHPGQAGYGLIAWLVLHNGWQEWVDTGA